MDHNWGTDTPDASVSITDGFSIRWSGYLKSPDYGIYTFSTALSGTDERVKLTSEMFSGIRVVKVHVCMMQAQGGWGGGAWNKTTERNAERSDARAGRG